MKKQYVEVEQNGKITSFMNVDNIVIWLSTATDNLSTVEKTEAKRIWESFKLSCDDLRISSGLANYPREIISDFHPTSYFHSQLHLILKQESGNNFSSRSLLGCSFSIKTVAF